MKHTTKLSSTVTVDGVLYGPVVDTRDVNETDAAFIARHFEHVRAFVHTGFPDGEWTGCDTELSHQ